MRVRPLLVKGNDGSVYVSGGIEENPNEPHEKLSDTQHGQKIMAPTSADQQVQQIQQDHLSREQPPATDPAPPATESAPPPPDSAPPLVGDPGSAAQGAPSTNPSSTDLPPAGR
jgi:hypothetical protein